MKWPSVSELVGEESSASSKGEGADDLADALREYHGHVATGNWKAAAKAFQSLHVIASAKATASDEGETPTFRG